MNSLIITLCFLAATACAGPLTPRFNGRIVHGETIDISQVPYQVAIGYTGAIWCGGSIIHERFVLTAAHCLHDKDLEDLIAYVGMTSIYEVEVEMWKPVKQVTVHPDYVRETKNYDIAVLELVNPLVYNAKAQPIALPGDGNTVPVGQFGYVSGWGSTVENGTASIVLQGTRVKFLEPRVCRFTNFDVSNMLCAGNLDGSSDSCKGDSGGPLVYDGILYGVVSFGHGCSRPGYASVYADVKKLLPFINNVIGA